MNNGVTKYAKTTVEIFFEPDHVACAYCPLLQTYSRNQCMRTGEFIIDTKTVGLWCPLEIKEVTECG